jgi:hypothetical protein
MKTNFILTILFLATNASAFPIRDGLFTLRGIIGSRAIASTVLNEINNELINENAIISELTNTAHKVEFELLYGITFAVSIYLQYKYFTYVEKRWSNVEMFSNIKDKTRTILFIFMLVFTKNIQNAI